MSIFLPSSIPLRLPFAHYRNFNFAKPIKISNPSSELTNYQIKVELNENNFPFSKCRSDGNDIRFLSDNRNVLDFWVESWSSTGATIWVKVDKIPSYSEKIIWLLYGNPSASPASKGTNTFEFFDDFEYVNEPLYPFTLGSEAIRGFPRPGVDIYNGGILPVDYIGRMEYPAKQWEYNASSNVNTVLVEDVDDDGKLEVIAFVHSTPNKVICVKWDGSGTKWEHALPGGEEFHDNTGMCGIIDDIYNDGTKEIVFYTVINHEVNGYIRCLNASGGSEEWNYYCNKGVETVGSDPNGMQVADIDGDGKKEIIALLDIPGEVLCLEHNGIFKWSKVEDGEDEYGAAVGDIDGDSDLEIVHGTEQHGLRIRNVSGVIETTYANPSGIYTSAVPSIKDVDGDGKLEILAGFDDLGTGAGKSLVMLEHDCTEKWSKTNLGGFDGSSFILGDIDGDSVDEAVVINYGPAGADMIMRCYNATNGTEKWTYNFGNITGRYIVGSPLAVDIDNDGELEILFLCRLDGRMYCISNTGTKKWSISVTAATPAARNTLVFSVTDMNRNGYLDIVVGSTTGIITCIVPGTELLEIEDRWPFISGSYLVQDSFIRFTSSGYAYRTPSYTDGHIYSAKMRHGTSMESNDESFFSPWRNTAVGVSRPGLTHRMHGDGNIYWYGLNNVSGNDHDLGAWDDDNNWHILTVKIDESENCEPFYDGVSKGGPWPHQEIIANYFGIGTDNDAEDNVDWDWIFVCKYASPEPLITVL